MIVNPFLSDSSLTAVLEREDCQRFHYHALREAVQGIHPEVVPESLPLAALRARARLDGAEVYLFHPTDIERLFAGVTLAVYRAVRTLYCSRLGRSIKMVWQLLRAMASAAGAAVLPYEAIWALCLHLEELRRASLEVHLERGHGTWWIGQTTPNIFIQEGSATGYQPAITWCVETRESRVLAFRIAPQNVACESAALALYDAITAHRRPYPRVATGLLWHLPKGIISTVTLSPSCHAACARGGIQVEGTTAELPFVQTIRETWERGVAGRVLRGSHCAALLDAYLSRTHGHGPLREREQREREYTSLVGYNQDPAWQFPLLREFLPLAASTITAEEAVPFDGLHYTHELLSYWPGYPVNIRRSVYAEAAAWIYLNGEILCRAHARELRRRDGSYRHFRPER
jgi:hypothetical protein